MSPLPSGHRALHWLKALRLDRGWTQLELAVETDLAESTIRRIEAGHPARLQTTHTLAAALGVSSQVLHAPPGLLG